MASKPSIFYIAGAPKTGTSALYDYLIKHPQVFWPQCKEFHHFCDDFFSVHMTDEQYVGAFSGMTSDHKLAPDGSVLYMYSDVAMRRIREFDPESKLIIMLRNPVDLVYSWHSQLLWNLNEDVGDFAEAWALCDRRAHGECLPSGCEEPFVVRYDEIGQLAKYLSRVYQVFPRSQVKVLYIEDMKADTNAVYQDVLGFLGLDPFELPEYEIVNPNTELRFRFLKRLEKMPLGSGVRRVLRNLKKAVGLERLSLRHFLSGLNTVETQRKPIDPELAQELLEFFSDDIHELSRMTDRNLDLWLQKKW